MKIRAASERDLPRLQEIEVLAGAAFLDVGMAEIAQADPPTVAALRSYVEGERCWVATLSGAQKQPDLNAGVNTNAEAAVAAFVILDVVDGQAHIEQISVDPSYARRGIGSQLIEHVSEWAGQQGCDAVTLTTFENVPWNAPYYRRCGFRVLQLSEVGPELAELRRREIEHGLDRWPRVCMRRDL